MSFDAFLINQTYPSSNLESFKSKQGIFRISNNDPEAFFLFIHTPTVYTLTINNDPESSSSLYPQSNRSHIDNQHTWLTNMRLRERRGPSKDPAAEAALEICRQNTAAKEARQMNVRHPEDYDSSSFANPSSSRAHRCLPTRGSLPRLLKPQR